MSHWVETKLGACQLHDARHAKRLAQLLVRLSEKPVHSIPIALERKYPRAGRLWIWQYVFPSDRLFGSGDHGSSPRGHTAKHRLPPVDSRMPVVQTPVHARGLHQRESAGSIRQRQGRTPNEVANGAAVQLRLALDAELSTQGPTPLPWQFDRTTLTTPVRTKRGAAKSTRSGPDEPLGRSAITWV
jgi:hypothetical protein